MHANSIVLLCLVILIIVAGHPVVSYAADSTPEAIVWQEDFESVTDPVKFVASNGDYIINFKGLTDEKSFSGKKAYKLDITLTGASKTTWVIRFNRPIPAAEKLGFSCRYIVQTGSLNNLGIVMNIAFDPLKTSLAGTSMYLMTFMGPLANEWRLLKRDDIVDYCRNKAPLIALPRALWGVEKDNVAARLEGIGILINGRKGDRVVVYFDDMRLEGSVPSATAYQQEVDKRWLSAKKRVEWAINQWDNALIQKERALLSFDVNTDVEKEIRRELDSKVSSLRKMVNDIKNRGVILAGEKRRMERAFTATECSRLSTVLSWLQNDDKMYIPYVLPSITGSNVLPKDKFIPGEATRDIRVAASPGEYEPASFVIAALDNMDSLVVKPTDLKGEKGVIGAYNIDIRIVKDWYQAGTAGYSWQQDRSKRVLVPELLLKDDGLIKVDYEKQENYLRVLNQNEEKYVWISNPEERTERINTHVAPLSIVDFYIKDSDKLLPINIPVNSNRQFWITVKVPSNANPGNYTGQIKIYTDKGYLDALNLQLKVLPIKLAEPYYASSIYYMSQLNEKYPQGTISSIYRSEEQIKNELENMVAHGITNPILYQRFDGKTLFEKHMKLRKKAGVKQDVLYTLLFLLPGGGLKLLR